MRCCSCVTVLLLFGKMVNYCSCTEQLSLMHRPTIAHALTEQLLVGYRPTIAHAQNLLPCHLVLTTDSRSILHPFPTRTQKSTKDRCGDNSHILTREPKTENPGSTCWNRCVPYIYFCRITHICTQSMTSLIMMNEDRWYGNAKVCL
jgi:hypothetical protein